MNSCKHVFYLLAVACCSLCLVRPALADWTAQADEAVTTGQDTEGHYKYDCSGTLRNFGYWKLRNWCNTADATVNLWCNVETWRVASQNEPKEATTSWQKSYKSTCPDDTSFVTSGTLTLGWQGCMSMDLCIGKERHSHAGLAA